MAEKQPVAIAAVPLAVPTGAPVPAYNVDMGMGMHKQEKQGSKCCGCCCDFRRAVIILAIIFIIFNILSLTASLSAFAIPGSVIGVDDDEVLEFMDERMKYGAILSGIGLFSSIVALVGAKQYNVTLVGFHIMWILVELVISIILNINAIKEANIVFADDEDYVEQYPSIVGYIIEGIVALLFVYPHVGFIHEVRAGIMSKETYPREVYSCCCVDGRR